MNAIISVLERVRRAPDLALAAVVAAILAAMVVPLPPWLLDIGLASNLAAAFALLVASLYAKDALRVTSFPTLLLFTTLFRLSLNVSSTRLALAEGHAGQIIQAFGEFVVRGDYVVGAVVFAILTLVQFLVVAKGAERVAEVSARFTLDAMPGKQMSIDADLRAGAIDQAQARKRRRELERESQMFGAMDGAMKFVKGDVIAGLVIVLVNLVGGLAVGVFEHGMTASEAAEVYALIAIGDGLVSQIPSLAIAVAAGLVVTRVSSEREDASLGTEIGAQFFGQARALWVVAALCGGMALIPGMPRLTFAALAAGFALAARFAGQRRAAKEAPRAEAASTPDPGEPAAAGAAPHAGVASLALDLGTELSALAAEPELVKATIEELRRRLELELGVRLSSMQVRTGAPYLPPNGYALVLEDVPCARGQLSAAHLYVLSPPPELAFLGVKGEAATDPATGKPMSRVPREARPVLEAAQIPVRDARQLICEHAIKVLRRRAADLLGVQDVQALLDSVEATAPALVREALGKVPLPLLTDVLKRLLGEEVSIRNLRAVLEALVAPSAEGDATALAERCRQALHRYLTYKYAPEGSLFAYLVDPAIEVALRGGGEKGALDPDLVGGILEGARALVGAGRAVVLAAPDIRRTLRKLCEGAFPDLAVLTYSELDPELQIRPIGRLAPVAR